MHLEKEILSFLHEKGLKILACKYVKITPELCRQLYFNEGYDYNKWLWELESEFFNLGESLCVLVKGKPYSEYKSVSDLIDQKLKGNNRPEYAKEGTIRRTFKAKNRIFNLFHSSDCTKAAKREAAIFFTAEELEQLENQETSCLLKRKEKRELDEIDLYFRIKEHCLQTGSIDPKVKGKYKDYLDEKKLQINRVRNSMKQTFLYQTLKEEYHLFYEDIQKDKLLKAITNYNLFKKINYNQLYQHLHKKGLTLTEWERCLLKTTMIASPKNF